MGPVESVADGGLPFGIYPDSRYESGRTALRPGDSLFVYTDGVTEATDTAGADYGDVRLKSLAVQMSGATAHQRV